MIEKLAAWAVPGWLKALIFIGGPAVLIGGAVWWHSGKVSDNFAAGQLAERKTWQAARAELMELRRERADRAADKAERRSAALPAQVQKGKDRVEIHWRDRPERDCLDVDSVRATEEARSILRRAAAASEGDNSLRVPAAAAAARHR